MKDSVKIKINQNGTSQESYYYPETHIYFKISPFPNPTAEREVYAEQGFSFHGLCRDGSSTKGEET